ncbi:hypothetical protein DI57_09065 [Enterobacter asburiae L1]|nr:hypothetical protein DI57_09065 [Enterobacter asburiae L1]
MFLPYPLFLEHVCRITVFSKKARTSLRSRAQTPMRPLSSSLRGLKNSSRRSALRMKKRRLPALRISVKIMRSIAITSWPERAKCR